MRDCDRINAEGGSVTIALFEREAIRRNCWTGLQWKPERDAGRWLRCLLGFARSVGVFFTEWKLKITLNLPSKLLLRKVVYLYTHKSYFIVGIDYII